MMRDKIVLIPRAYGASRFPQSLCVLHECHRQIDVKCWAHLDADRPNGFVLIETNRGDKQ